jgi:chitinase
MWLPQSFGDAKIVAIVLLLVHQSTAALASIPDSLSTWLDTHPITTRVATVPIVSSNRTLSSAAVKSQRSRCPISCDEIGLTTSNWTVYHDLSRLELCNQTMLLDFALHNSLDDPTTQISVRSCAANFGADASNVESTSSGTCPSHGNRTEVEVPMQIAFNGTGSSGSLDDFTIAAEQLQLYLAQQKPGCNATTAYMYHGSATIGVFAGSGTQNVSADIFQQFVTEVQRVGISESVLVQLCANPGRNRSSKYSLGMIASANANLGFVQDAVSTWASGNCVTAYDSSDTWQNVTVSVPSLQPNSAALHSNATLINGRSPATLARALSPRGSCSTIQVVSGDTCKLPREIIRIMRTLLILILLYLRRHDFGCRVRYYSCSIYTI